MKPSPIFTVHVVRVLAILTLAQLFVAHAQISFLQPPGGPVNMDADFNRDGKLDIVTPGTLLLGNGDGTFKAPINLSVPGNLVVTVDFNGDGNSDLLIASTRRNIYGYRHRQGGEPKPQHRPTA
jgi:hypothetical protein